MPAATADKRTRIPTLYANEEYGTKRGKRQQTPLMSLTMQLTSDPRRADRERRFKPPPPNSAPAEDLTTDYMNILGMVFSMCGLMMRLKWCAWTAVFCSSISFANSRVSDDTKQIVSSFMLSISAVVMSYLQNPSPMSPPWYLHITNVKMLAINILTLFLKSFN
ncbi:UPF0139 membrane protein pMsmaA27 [Papilio xuthus]|uniref:UPF0139 membrane protein pMsmaA27 n=1 Tax=Papilio xuthus TaxID=66420 RepID=A0A194Q9V2_PAPXU|nr:UPF0139 membrane protein pMsmaA27 [Papilio xuthus]